MAEYRELEAVLRKIKELQATNPNTVGKKQFADGYFCGLDEAEIVVRQAPAADVAEVRYGEWIYSEFDIPHCSECGKEVLPMTVLLVEHFVNCIIRCTLNLMKVTKTYALNISS